MVGFSRAWRLASRARRLLIAHRMLFVLLSWVCSSVFFCLALLRVAVRPQPELEAEFADMDDEFAISQRPLSLTVNSARHSAGPVTSRAGLPSCS